uniref:Uncharacterized protein n=1 Tax=Oryza glumipatula TaxID=40148 RepID=A0A0E0AX59_9ORYZ
MAAVCRAPGRSLTELRHPRRTAPRRGGAQPRRRAAQAPSRAGAGRMAQQHQAASKASRSSSSHQAITPNLPSAENGQKEKREGTGITKRFRSE